MNDAFDNNNEDSLENQEFLDNLKMENEIKKIKLSLEHGMDLSDQLSAAELPPKIESELLDYIARFEEQFSTRKMILIDELLGKPELKPVSEIADADINAALTNLQNLLKSKSISLETLNKVDERELYRFITEELLKLETNDVQIEGLIHCYIYEEFHPNHEADVKETCDNFYNRALDISEEINLSLLGIDRESVEDETNAVLNNKMSKLQFLRAAFESFEIESIAITSVAIYEEETLATSIGTIKYVGQIENSADTVLFEGAFKINLQRANLLWKIINFEFPGINN